jgi:hypothetical protein
LEEEAAADAAAAAADAADAAAEFLENWGHQMDVA